MQRTRDEVKEITSIVDRDASNEVSAQPVAKRIKLNEFEAQPKETETATAPDPNQGQRMSTVKTSNVEDMNSNLEAMLQRELASRLIQQQQQYMAMAPLLHQSASAFPFVGGLPLMAGGIAMPPLVNMSHHPLNPSGLNFALPTQVGGAHPLMFFAQATPPTSGVASAHSLAPAFAMNLLGQNLEGFVNGGGQSQNLLAAVALGQQQLQLALQNDPQGSDSAGSASQRVPQSHQDAEEGSQTTPLVNLGNARSTSSPSTTVPPPKAFPMALDTDENTISKYQCILRKQIEFFEAGEVDMRARAQGRNLPIRFKQVGIRCIHCAKIPAGYRPRGAVYFPVKLESLYQSSQNMANNHFNGTSCKSLPPAVLEEFNELKRDKPSRLGNGVQRYWVETARQLGLVDSEVSGIVYREHLHQAADK